MNNFEVVCFSTLYSIPSRNGLMRPRSVRGEGYKMINMGELFKYPRIDNPNMELVKLNDREISIYNIEEYDLLFARQSLVLEGAGKCSVVISIDKPSTFESHLIRIRLNKKVAHALFYFYYFSSKTGFGSIQSIVNQVAAAGIRGSDLAKLKVLYPALSTQKRITAILSAYDDLIENNKRRIALLEKMAEEIYREWFVRFRFPDYQTAEFEKGIPKGWKIRELSEIAKINNSNLKKSNSPEYLEYIDIGSVTTNCIEQGVIYHRDDAPGRAKRLVKHGDIIWSSVRPANKVYSLISHPNKNLVVSTGFAVITPIQEKYYPFIYQAATTDIFVDQITAVAKGTAYPATSFDDYKKTKILVPDDQLIGEYFNNCNPIYEYIFSLRGMNNKLEKTKNMLLPRLISGKLSVEDLDIQFPSSMMDEAVE